MTGSIAVCAIGWLLGWWAFGRPRRVGTLPAGSATTGPVTVVVPARDEALSIGGVLDDLLASRPAPDRIVVVDDHSTDATAAIAAARPGVEVAAAPPLPAGWAGKCWACHTGALGVEDGTLVFADADVRLAPDALGRVVAHGQATGGLVSVQPWHVTGRPYEQASAMFNVIAIMGSAAGARGGADATAAFGPLMSTSVEDYRAVGGHAAVRDQAAEDLALGRRYRDAGLGSRLLVGGRAVRFRMYPGGPRQLVEGWTKNFATGAGSTRLLRLLAVVAWIAALGTGALLLVDGLRGERSLAVGAVAYAAMVAQVAVLFRAVGRFGPLSAALYPLHLVVFVLVFVRSLWSTHVRREVRWRGRTIPVDGGVDGSAAPGGAGHVPSGGD
ncbi:glycosyltransferase [Dermatobacter hominis]|uniref:glycosyltransferase n=1 Tax=Dermatobacter hominis TaxID=2884263 RepID=UPI001D0FB38E|nr:glycosyltransferase family A protein [Dermatobacter hominis]UDY37728.1 glycosyltransferase family 2 protein [Dermatobacter hominis]